MPAHINSIDGQLAVHGTDPARGLDAAQVGALRGKYGENRLPEAARRGMPLRLCGQLRCWPALALTGAAVVSAFLAVAAGESVRNPALILGFVALGAALNAVRECRAERAPDALRGMGAREATVLRGGEALRIDAAELVPGDLLLLRAGDVVPADARLVESAGVQCDEAALTGAPAPVDKAVDARVHPAAQPGERANMVHAGCAVTAGWATAVVSATGAHTEAGKAALMQGARTGARRAAMSGAGGQATAETRAEKQRAVPPCWRMQPGRMPGIPALAVGAAVFLAGTLRGLPAAELLLMAVVPAVAVDRQSVVPVAEAVRTLGARRMAGHGAVVRWPQEVEALGGVTVICANKTGTLTENRMQVRALWAVGGGDVEAGAGEPDARVRELLRLGALCADGTVELSGGEIEHVGDPTETAVAAGALLAGLRKGALEAEAPRVAELPFDGARGRMTTVHGTGGGYTVITKGALDAVLPLCPAADREAAERAGAGMGARALRVLAVARKTLDALPVEPDAATLESGLTLVGLIGVADPPREESEAAVALCREAGVRTVMVTADHAATAAAVARETGILRHGERVLTGAELAGMDDAALDGCIEGISVFARVGPADKVRIVRAWQARGGVVAAAGDGPGDAPALRAADSGCAVGAACDAAKDAADLLLPGGGFAEVAEAVRQARGVYRGVRRAALFLLGTGLAGAFVVFAAILAGWGAPLLAVHLLLINAVTGALTAPALGLVPADDGVMPGPPPGQEFFTGWPGLATVLQGLMAGALALAAYRIGLRAGVSEFVPPGQGVGMTMAFLTLCLALPAQALNGRSSRSLFQTGFFTDKRMNRALAASGLLAVLLCAVTPLERLFRLEDLSVLHWVVVLALSLTPLLVTEMVKLACLLAREGRCER